MFGVVVSWHYSVAMYGRGEGLLIQILIWIFAAVLLGAMAGAIYQKIGLRRDSWIHPPPGRFVDLGTHRLHLLEKGQGSPTIVLEAGLMSTVLSWSEIQSTLSQSYRVVSYDRAGLGWSDLGPMPRTADRMVEELHTLLQRAAIPPPYVLVGHSFGGLTMPLFAARYPEETAGVVLVDPVAPAEWNPPSEQDRKRAEIGATVSRRADVTVPHRRYSFRGVPAHFRRNEIRRTLGEADQPGSARRIRLGFKSLVLEFARRRAKDGGGFLGPGKILSNHCEPAGKSFGIRGARG